MTHRLSTLSLAAGTVVIGSILVASLGGCRSSNHQFSGQLRYGNLMSHQTAVDSRAAAKQQLIELTQAYGLEARHIGEDRMTFVAQAPTYSVTQPDGAIEERRDLRVVKIDVILDEHLGRNTYRYYCSIEGNEPLHFTDDDRARFGLALLAVREIFEKPIATSFLGG